MTFDPPEIEKGRDIKKPEMDPRHHVTQPGRKDRDPNRGIPKSNNLPNDDKPSTPMEPGRGQAQFMTPERPGQNTNERSGAV